MTSRALAALAASVVVAGSLLAAPVAEARTPVTDSFTLTGHGWGHGHGLSQYGARGAARQGLKWRQIVGFYYPGTAVTKAQGKIRVLITADTRKDVMVDAQPGLSLHKLAGGKGKKTFALAKVRPRATRWRIKPAGQGRSTVDFKLSAGGWQRWASVPGSAEFTSHRTPITLHLPGRATSTYRGSLRSVDRQTVNVVSLESYLRGVVPSEMPADWEQQALRAQAVAARTYAAFERANATGDYDICDTSSCQVYLGAGHEQPGSDEAVRRTAGRIVSYQGAPAFTQFSSSDGGWNAAGSAPYLVAQPDPYEAASDNPNATWTATVTVKAVQKAYPAVGSLTDITLGDRDGNGDWGGRVGQVTLTGAAGTLTVAGDDFRLALGLKSTWFTFG